MANDTRFGLAATLVTGDQDRAERVSAALDAGTVWVNCFFVRDLGAPFGGNGKSGIGREGGIWSLRLLLRRQEHRLRPGRLDRRPTGGSLMGEVVGAGLLAHVPTIVLPEEDRRELNDGEDITLVSGLQQLRREVFDVARLRHRRRPRLALGDHGRVRRHRPGPPGGPVHLRGAAARHVPAALRLPRRPRTGPPHRRAGADEHGTWITAIDDHYLPIFYATTNLWEFLGQGLPDKRWISIGVCQTADTEDNLRLGRALGDGDRRSPTARWC